MEEFHRPSGPLTALPGVRPLAEFSLDRKGDEERPGLFVQSLQVNGPYGQVWLRIRPSGFVQSDAAFHPPALSIGGGPGHDKATRAIERPPVSACTTRGSVR